MISFLLQSIIWLSKITRHKREENEQVGEREKRLHFEKYYNNVV
jgi:hypothetical protein